MTWSEVSTAKRWDWLLSLTAALTSLFCIALVTTFPWGRDQSIYALIGDGILHGKAPYLDRWDFKPPGVYFVYAAAQSWFGRTMAAIRILEAAGLLMMAACLVFLGHKLQGSALAGWFAAAIAHLPMSCWTSGTRVNPNRLAAC